MRKLPAFLLSASLLLPYASIPSVVQAASQQQSQQVQLTYQQAIERALNKSYSLKNTKADVERSEEVLNKAGENVKFTPIPNGNPYTYDAYNSAANRAFTGYQQANIGYQLSKEQVRIDEDTIAVSVRKAYNDVLHTQIKKRLADITLQNDEMQRSIAQFKYQSGVYSNVDNVKADSTYQADKKAKEAAEKELVSAYQSLNQLVGLPADARPILTEQLQFENMPEVDLEGHISRILSDNPLLTKASKGIEKARLDLDLFMFNQPGSVETYDVKKIDLEKAENTYASAKEQVEKGLRSAYYSIRKLEDDYKGLQEKLVIAEEGLRVAKVQYDVGMATKLEVSNAELAVEQLKEKMAAMTVAHDNAVQAFYKPWAAQGAQ